MAEYLTQAEFAKRIGVTRQAVYKAVRGNVLECVLINKKKYINLDCYKTIQYMKDFNNQRITLLEPVQKQKKGGKNGVITTKGATKKNKTGKIPNKQQIPNTDVEPDESIDSYKRMYIIARAKKVAEEVIKKKLENAAMRGELISREKVYNIVILFLDKVLQNLERLADTFLSDIGGKIITDGKVTPEIRQRWRDQVFSQLDDAKTQTIQKIEEIEKEQAK